MRKLRNWRHIVSIILTVGALLGLFFLFFNSLKRLILNAVPDFATSFVYLLGFDIEPTVKNLPLYSLSDIAFIPKTDEVFLAKVEIFFKMLINSTTLEIWWLKASNIIYVVTQILLVLILLITITIIIFAFTGNTVSNDDNVNTKPLNIFLKIKGATYDKAKALVLDYIDFIFSGHKVYFKIWLIIVLLEFNVFTIAVEFLAFYFYMIAGIELTAFPMQFYKLFLDILVPFSTLPLPFYVVPTLYVFAKVRKYLADKRIYAHLDVAEEFTRNLSLVTLICGTMNTKKTTFLTALSLIQSKLDREKALDVMLDIDAKFPLFPFINLERCIRRGIQTHAVYNLATAKRFINKIEEAYIYLLSNRRLSRHYLKSLRRQYGYYFNNYLFDYEASCGMSWTDGTKLYTLFDCLRDYAKAFFVYVIDCSLVYSNYSIRTDDVQEDVGNFPVWDFDYLNRDVMKREKESRFSHVLHYDILRLGKRVIKNNAYAGVLDIGIVSITEIGKERGNKFSGNGSKKEEGCNQNNDLMNHEIKMCRHHATIANHPFIHFFTDEQRPEDWGANARELADVLYIKSSTDFEICSPLFALDELVYSFIHGIYNRFLLDNKFYRSDNTLKSYLVKNFYNIIYNAYQRNFARYAISKLKLKTSSGRDLDDSKNTSFVLCKVLVHSDRFSTDSHAGFFEARANRSKLGIIDVPEYKGLTADMEELHSQESFFVKDIEENTNLSTLL